MSEVNEKLNFVENKEEYFENIPLRKDNNNRCACGVILIIVFSLYILFSVLYLSYPKGNSWALIFLLIIDVPLGLYIRCAQCNKPKESPMIHQQIKY